MLGSIRAHVHQADRFSLSLSLSRSLFSATSRLPGRAVKRRGGVEARASERKKDRPARRLAASAVNKGIGRTGFAAVLAVERNLVAKGSLALKVKLRSAPAEARTRPPLGARSRVLLEGRVPVTHQRSRERRMARCGRRPTCPRAPRGTQCESDVYTQMLRPQAARTAYKTRTHVFLLAAAASHCGSASRAPAPGLLRLEL